MSIRCFYTLVVLLSAGAAASLPSQQVSVPPIDTISRQAVVEAYRSYYLTSENVPLVWAGGSYSAPSGGVLNAEFRDSAIRRINWYRALTGLPGTVVTDDTLNFKCQAGALMISAAAAFPPYTGVPTSWPSYSADGAAGCQNSDLSLNESGPTAVSGLMADPGLSSVGHRRHLLLPGLQRTGIGATPRGEHSDAQVLWTSGPYGTVASVSAVAWPSAGYFPLIGSSPYGGIPEFWSLFYGSADFTSSTVAIKKNGSPINSEVTYRYPNSSTLGTGVTWRLPGDVSTAGDLYEVTVSGVNDAGQTRTFIYTVRPFDPDASKLINVSTRLRVETGDNVGIAGFVVAGEKPRRVVVRALGPSLTNVGVAGALSNPTLVLRDAANQIVAQNDDWQTEVAMTDAATAQGATPLAISDTGLAPTNPREAAVALMLPPGAYTAVVTGVAGEMGVALVEVYDLDPSNVDSRAVNVSTRGRVQSGDNVMIGGFVVSGGTSARNVVVRALGPSLAAVGVTGTLQDPVLEVIDSRGQRVALVDDYDPAAAAALGALKPTDSREAAVRLTLAPGAYTAVVRGKGGAAGVALVEAYEVQ